MWPTVISNYSWKADQDSAINDYALPWGSLRGIPNEISGLGNIKIISISSTWGRVKSTLRMHQNKHGLKSHGEYITERSLKGSSLRLRLPCQEETMRRLGAFKETSPQRSSRSRSQPHFGWNYVRTELNLLKSKTVQVVESAEGQYALIKPSTLDGNFKERLKSP